MIKMGRGTRLAAASLLAATLGAAVPAMPSVGAAGTTGCANSSAGLVGLYTEPCDGVRPGGVVEIAGAGFSCTLNFIFRGSDGATYAGTAGFCAVTNIEEAWLDGSGPLAYNGAGQRIGRVTYAANIANPDITRLRNFALIKLDPGVAYSPQLCHYGGPLWINSEVVPPTQPVLLQTYERPFTPLTDTVRGITFVSAGMPNAYGFMAEWPDQPGVDGAPVITPSGGAIGWIAQALPDDVANPTLNGLGGILRVRPSVARATALTGVTYTMLTAPLL
jgi:hypothetical protein